MPSVSKKQHNLMAAVANNPKFAKKVGIKQSVGEEFISADKGKQFKSGGSMAESKKMVKKEVEFMKKKGAPKSMVKHEMSEMMGMKKGGMAKTKKMAFGGPASIAAGLSPVRAAVNNAGKAVGAGTSIANAAINALKNAPPPTTAAIKQGLSKKLADRKNMASGGYTRAADGIASKGKTKAKQVKMSYGGKC
jgi:hypothetical protein